MSDIFVADRVNPDSKKFDTVSRIVAQPEPEQYLDLDVNTDTYPMAVGMKYTLAFAKSQNSDGTPVDIQALADEYEYLMRGTIDQISDIEVPV